MKKEDPYFNSKYLPYNNDINISIMNMNIKKEFDFDNQKLFKGNNNSNNNNLPFLQLPPFKMENEDYLKFSSQNNDNNKIPFLVSSKFGNTNTNHNSNENSNNSQDDNNSFSKSGSHKGKNKMSIDDMFSKNYYTFDLKTMNTDDEEIEEAIRKMEESIKVEVKDEPYSKRSKKSKEVTEDSILEKRRKNTEAARRSRMRKVLKIMNLEKKVKLLEERGNQMNLYIAKQQQEKELLQQNYSNILNNYYFLQKKMEKTREIINENKYRLPPDIFEKLDL